LHNPDPRRKSFCSWQVNNVYRDRRLGVKDTKELLDFEIYPNLDRAETVKDLNPQDKG
jgi:hypothetical protein